MLVAFDASVAWTSTQWCGKPLHAPCVCAQMDMMVPGHSPGDSTKRHLTAMLTIVRLIGALSLIALYASSKFVDKLLLSMAGVRVSVVEFLIVVGTISHAARQVCSSCTLAMHEDTLLLAHVVTDQCRRWLSGPKQTRDLTGNSGHAQVPQSKMNEDEWYIGSLYPFLKQSDPQTSCDPKGRVGRLVTLKHLFMHQPGPFRGIYRLTEIHGICTMIGSLPSDDYRQACAGGNGHGRALPFVES
jgi:hypothetical protein